MAEDVKFTKEEMAQINELQQTYLNLQNTIGQLGVARIRLDQQYTDLEVNEDNTRAQFTENQNKERNFVDTINKKYGDGNLDLTTGVFKPKPTEETTEKTDKTL
jgi:hypothetical protein